LLQLRLLLGELLDRRVTLLLQLVDLDLALARQRSLLIPRLSELLNLRLPLASELFLGRFRLLGLLQLRLLLGELLDRRVTLLLQLVDPDLALARQRSLLVPRLGELLNLLLPFASELFLGRLRLLGLLQLRLLLHEFLNLCIAYLA
jgi:hypothetical protein